MALSRGFLIRVTAVVSVLAIMALVASENSGTKLPSPLLRHRALQEVSQHRQAVSSQHQSSYQQAMGQMAQPQTYMLKNHQEAPLQSSMVLSQLQPQNSLWNTRGSSGSPQSSSMGDQQAMQQQSPNGNIQQLAPPNNRNQLSSAQQQIGGMQLQSYISGAQKESTHDSSSSVQQPLPMVNQRTQVQNNLHLLQMQQQQVPHGNTAHSTTGSQQILQQQNQQLQIPQNAPQQQVVQQQRSSKQDPQYGVSVPDQDPNCEVPNAAEVAVANPAWTASYPGSGAKLTWKLIRAITGIFTSDDHDHNGRVAKGMVVAVKTHFPSHTPPEVFNKENLSGIRRAILLTRNPINSIPSYHNFVYEVQNGLVNHSTRAPIEAWIKWRNALFEDELQAWIDHQKYWLDNYSRDKLHLVSMEHLTSEVQGPGTIQRLGQFLASDGNQDIADSMVPYERMPCIWDMFVHGKVPGERERRHSHRSGGPKTYPFTQLQLDQMIAALAQFKNDYAQHQDLSIILEEYIVTIQDHKGKIEQM